MGMLPASVTRTGGVAACAPSRARGSLTCGDAVASPSPPVSESSHEKAHTRASFSEDRCVFSVTTRCRGVPRRGPSAGASSFQPGPSWSQASALICSARQPDAAAAARARGCRRGDQAAPRNGAPAWGARAPFSKQPAAVAPPARPQFRQAEDHAGARSRDAVRRLSGARSSSRPWRRFASQLRWRRAKSGRSTWWKRAAERHGKLNLCASGVVDFSRSSQLVERSRMHADVASSW